MRGVEYLIDERGRKKAAVIDLRTWGRIWEDFQDVLVSESRKNEPTVSWETLKAEVEQEHARAK